ncbi:MAG: VWA domain-containing protein [Candidatus Marinimicrobia bacterium]|nr:VWA domain-containing protein [Candidatus Neomarinimicrobiota bacterium]
MLSFSHPQVLWFLLLIPVIAVLGDVSARNRRRRLQEHIHPETLGRLFAEDHRSIRGLKHVLLLLAIGMMILALSGLRYGSGLKELKQEGMDVVVALDLSSSMSATDITPSRLERSKYEVMRLISLLKGDRIGLVGFAGVAHLQCPITSDYRTAGMLLEMMDTDLLPVQGTAFAEAINTACEAFPDEQQKYKAVILISDGEDHEQDIGKAVERAGNEGVQIYTLGVGTRKGARIPVYDRSGTVVDYKRDSRDRVITTALQENTLKDIASSTGGRYYRLGADKDPVNAIYDHILHGERREYQTHEFARYQELYLIFAALALIFLIFAVVLPETVRKKR